MKQQNREKRSPKVEDMVINNKDVDNARYQDAGELLPCPFCGSKPLSYGVRNERTQNVVYKISCPNMKCNANTFACMGTDAEESRVEAVSRWNKRQPKNNQP